MKKISVLTVMGVMFSGVAIAAANDSGVPAPDMNMGGFVGETVQTIVTVKDAQSMPDDTVLVLRGNIIKSLGDEKYTFQDETGTIVVEIDNDDWNGQTVAPTDTVTLYGEVDSGLFKTEIDVDRIQIVQQ